MISADELNGTEHASMAMIAADHFDWRGFDVACTPSSEDTQDHQRHIVVLRSTCCECDRLPHQAIEDLASAKTATIFAQAIKPSSPHSSS